MIMMNRDKFSLHDGRFWCSGTQAQMKQLAGMRGLIAKPSGEIIRHNYFKFKRVIL